jgi:diguanylate cyclase (GGDEF)-like protein
VLVAVASRLRDSTRGSDLIARLGGDEFAVLLEVRDTAEVGAVAQRILRALRQRISHGGAIFTVGASVGIASTRPGSGALDTGDRPLSAAELVKAADEAMYAAKSTGGDRLVVAESIAQSTHAESDVRFPAVA